jgi:hypothetical protein
MTLTVIRMKALDKRLEVLVAFLVRIELRQMHYLSPQSAELGEPRSMGGMEWS